MPFLVGYITPQDYGAVGNGTTDDTTAINSALTAAGTSGTQVYIPAATYLISGPLNIPSNVAFESMQGLRVKGSADPAPLCTLKLAASFSGNGAIVLPANSAGQRIRRINIDGTLATGSVAGIYAVNYVHDVFVEEVNLYKLPGDGIHLATASGNQPYSWNITNTTANTCGGVGFNLSSTTDTTLIGCEAIGCTGNGFTLFGISNSHMTNCRAEFNSIGYSISGAWNSGTGSGGFTMTGCSSDRNVSHGISVTATGTIPITINGFMSRRDASNGSDFGVNLNGATTPVVFNGLTVFPGVNDDGSGTNTPVTGFQATSCTYVQLNGSFVQGATNAVVDGGSNTFFLQSENLGTATGTTASPTRPSVYSHSTPVCLDVINQALGMQQPRSHGAIAWTGDPASVSTGQAGTAGTVYLARVDVPRTVTATKLYWGINTAGSGVTAGQNFVGLYNTAGTRLANVGIDARITTTGLFTETISAALTPGVYWVAWVINATGMPQIYRHASFLTATLLTFNQGTTNFRWATNATTQTSLPSPLTVGSNTASMFSYFAAIQ